MNKYQYNSNIPKMKQGAKPNPLEQIKKIQLKRQQRRKKMQQEKLLKQEKKALNLASGKNVDIDFEIMIQKNKYKQKLLCAHKSSVNDKLAVCVRKRPIFKKQEQNGQIDSISCANPQIKIHEPKYKVDGITKFVQNHTFTFDNTFNEQEATQDIYKVSLKPLLNLLLTNGIVTCFAYGQTGSGKTFTMNGLQKLVVSELFQLIKKKFTASVSFFEIYSNRCLDLLNNKQALQILEDKSNNIQIQGLTEKNVNDANELLKVMEEGNTSRTTQATAANDTSSRSHSICYIYIRKGKQQVGKLVLVDLAGSQRAQDTQSNNRQRRLEGAQINKSLLALKECIRAMDDKADHIPFRASKLTLILRDSFTGKAQKSKVVMIACINPGSSSADHSLNTLRYADRLKDNSQLNEKYNKIVEQNRKKQILNADNGKDQLQKINIGQSTKKQKQEIKKPQQLTKLPEISREQMYKTTNKSSQTSQRGSMSLANHNKSLHSQPHTLAQPQKKKIQRESQAQPQPQIQSQSQGMIMNKKLETIQQKEEQIKKSLKQKEQNKKQATQKKQEMKKKQEKYVIRSLSVKKAGNITSTHNETNPIVADEIDLNIKQDKIKNKKSLQLAKKPLRYHSPQIPDQTQLNQYSTLNSNEANTINSIRFSNSLNSNENNKISKPVKDDVSLMKKTFQKNNSLNPKQSQNYFAFQEKVTNVLDHQQEVLAIHMAAIKQDAKLLTQQSQLVTKVQTDNEQDNDIDKYVQRLESMVSQKIKMYGLLVKKVQQFKKILQEEDEARRQVKQAIYY